MIFGRNIAEVAAETGAILIDTEAVMLADGEHFNGSVHFRDAGSRVTAER